MTITITWLGTAAYVLDLVGTKLMFDPFFFRQTNKRATPVLKTKREDISDINAVFISHGHIDHITDAGWYAENLDIPVYCSEVAKENIIKWATGEILEDQAHNFTEKGQNNIKVVEWGEIIKINENVSVEIIKSKHIRFDANTIFARLKSKAFWKEIKSMLPFKNLGAGKVLAFCIHFKDKKIITYGSLYHKYKDILKKYENCDVYISPTAGNSKKHLAKKCCIMIDILKPKVVIPLHWDDFFPPISRIEDLKPLLSEIEKKWPKIQVMMPKMDEELTINLE